MMIVDFSLEEIDFLIKFCDRAMRLAKYDEGYLQRPGIEEIQSLIEKLKALKQIKVQQENDNIWRCY
jgi:hypothetical protein